MFIIFELKQNCQKVKLIERKHAERLVNFISTKKVIELAFRYWSLDNAKGVVALDLSQGTLVGYSVDHSFNKRPSSKQEIILFELDANVDVIDESILLGNAGVKAVRSYFNIDDETFSENMTYWTEKYLNHHNLTIDHLRNRFIKVLYKDYKQAFFNTCTKKQLDQIYLKSYF